MDITNADSSLRIWSWAFLVVYTGAMLVFGALGLRRVRGSDDFATARGGYGPVLMAFAFAATTASGATFLGLPGLAYASGMSSLSHIVGYPIGAYCGVLLCMRVVARAGHAFGNRSIPEYLGDRFQSDALRIMAASFSLMLFFYLAGQLVAGLVMFEQMLGLPKHWALGFTVAVLMLYVTLGGAHADILTDAAQGALMFLIAIAVAVMFFTGVGTDGGLVTVFDRIRALDPETLTVLNSKYPLFDAYWDIYAIVAACVPLGLLPHIGNKLWALHESGSRGRFIPLVFALGMTLPLIGLGGVLARAVLGDALLQTGGANQAIPALFIEVFPTWLAAFLGIGILAAVMSTADGLVVSSAQVFANDLYRRTFAPIWHPDDDEATIDRRVLSISRWATVCVLAGASLLAWALLDTNVALLVWMGVGGMMAALAGPLVLGVVWRGVTRAGALAGFAAGAGAFVFLKAGFMPEVVAGATSLSQFLAWLHGEAPNPYSCAAIGQLASVATTVGVSLFTRRLPDAHLTRVFG